MFVSLFGKSDWLFMYFCWYDHLMNYFKILQHILTAQYSCVVNNEHPVIQSHVQTPEYF